MGSRIKSLYYMITLPQSFKKSVRYNMFKIKKSTKKVGPRDPLIENNLNQHPNWQRQRPSSFKIGQRNMSQCQLKDTLPNLQFNHPSLISLGTDQQYIIPDRSKIQEEVRKICSCIFKENKSYQRQVKEHIISRVVDKSISRPDLWDDLLEGLRQLIEIEIHKIQKSNEIIEKCQSRENRIESMIEERLIKLGMMR